MHFSKQYIDDYHMTYHMTLTHTHTQYLYAFSISPMSSMDEKELIQQPPVATDCPYTDIVKAMVRSILYGIMYMQNT